MARGCQFEGVQPFPLGGGGGGGGRRGISSRVGASDDKLRFWLRHLPSLSSHPSPPPAVGEAISYAFGGVSVTADRMLLSNFTGLADEFSLLTTTATTVAAAPESAPTTGSPPASADGAVAVVVVVDDDPALAATRSWVLGKLLDEMVVHSRAEVGV